MPLSDLQLRFCEEYLVDLNASQAALRAGYSKQTAYSSGQRLLKDVEVAEEIDRLKAERTHRTKLTADRVIRELSVVGFSDPANYFFFERDGVAFRPNKDIPPEARRAIASIKVRQENATDSRPGAHVVEIKLWNKVDALKQLLEHVRTTSVVDDSDEPDFSKLTPEEMVVYERLLSKILPAETGTRPLSE